MKKFLFTLAALLMAVTSFAQTDAKYLYVNTDLCEDLGINPATGDHEMLLVISAEFPAYLNAFEAEIHAPEGMTIDLLEVGDDCKVTYYNARGKEQTWTPSISIGTGAADQSHFIIAGMQSGYDYVDGVLTDIITVKWAPGYHEEFILATAIIDDEVYNGGDIPIITKPASGRDPRTTITDLGDSQVPHETPATEPLPDPTPDVVAPDAPVITFSGEETTTMTVTVTAEEGCTLIVNGEGISSNTYIYTVTRDDIYTPGTVNVTAKAVKDGVESDEATGSKAFIVADFPVADQPVINFVETKNDNDEVVSVEVVVTNATSYIITVDGVEVDAAVVNANYAADQAIYVYAVNAPGYPYEENFNEADYTLVKLAKKAVADPVISTSMDDNNVYVTITWPAETDGNQIYTGEYTYARPEYGEADQSYPVEAYVEEGSEWLPSGVTTATIPVPAKAPVWQDVAAPEISYTMDDNNVYVTINWPETTGEHKYDGEYTYARPEYGEADQSYAVEAYTEADYPYNESVHATETIPVPAKDPVWQDVAAPVISYTMDADNVYVTINWPETTGEHKYDGEYTYARPEYGEADQSYPVEAYTEADYPYNESVHATATIPVPAKAPVWQDVAAPEISYTMDDDNVYVTINWPETTGEHKYDGEYTYARPEYGEADQSYPVEAYTEADYPYNESVHATETIPVPAKEPVWQDVAAPVIETSMDDDNVYVTITWPETTGEHKYNGEYTYARAEEEYTVDVEAYTEADYPYNESVHATATIPVPAKEPVGPVETMTFVKVASTADLVFGKKYIIVCGNKAMGVEATGNFLTAIDITGGDEVEIADNSGVAIMTLGGVTGYYTLELDGSYLNAANSTSLQFGNATEWAISDYNGTLAGFRVKHVSYNRSVRYSAGYDRFGNYSTSDQNSEYGWIYVEKSEEPVKIDPATPEINYETLADKVVVTVTWNESDGNKVYTGEYEYARPEYGQPDESYNVEAYTEASDTYNESAHATETIPVPAKDPEWVEGTAPVIEFIPTMDGNIVTEVEVVVTGADTYTIKVNGEALRGEKIAASYDEVKNIHVEAVKNANYPYMEATAQGDYTLNRLVAAPVISTEVLDDVVNVTIVWPATEGTQEYTGEYTYERGDADQTFNVEAYTTAAGDYQESFHATETIVVPAKAPELTPDPVIDITTGKYNEKYVEITCEDPDAVIYYRVQYENGEWSDWAIYDGKTMYKENGHYNIEAYAVSTVTGQSSTVDDEFIVSNCTAVGEVMSGKTISSVRYFNLAGQEMQEANGMTIIVTTYTDGTSSAVKVMK